MSPREDGDIRNLKEDVDIVEPVIKEAPIVDNNVETEAVVEDIVEEVMEEVDVRSNVKSIHVVEKALLIVGDVDKKAITVEKRRI